MKILIITAFLSMFATITVSNSYAQEKVKWPYAFMMAADLPRVLKFCTGLQIYDTKKIGEQLIRNDVTGEYDRNFIYINANLLVFKPDPRPFSSQIAREANKDKAVTPQLARQMFDATCLNQVDRTNDQIDIKEKIFKAIETKSKHYPQDIFVNGGLVDVPFTLEYVITKDGFELKSIF